MLAVVKQIVRNPAGGMPPHVIAKPMEGDIEVRPMYYGVPPPLLSYIWVEGSTGAEYVAGTLTDVRENLWEDFTQVPSIVAPSSGGPHSGNLPCDTNWRYNIDSNTEINDPGPITGQDAIGVAYLNTASATANRQCSIRKSNRHYSYTGPAGWSMSFKVALNIGTTQMTVYVGLLPDDFTNSVIAVYDAAGTAAADWLFAVSNGSGGASNVACRAAAVTGWQEFDITFVPGDFAYCSLNGQSPVWLTVGVPPRTQSAEPYAYVNNKIASQRRIWIDYFRVQSLYGDIAHPEREAILTGVV